MMTSTDNLIDALISRASAAREIEEFVFLPAFPPHKTLTPVRKYTVAVESRELGDEAVFIGGRIARNACGRLVKVKLRLRVYAPHESSGAALLRASSMAASALERADSGRLIRAISFYGIEYDTAAHSKYRDIGVILELPVTEEAPDE